MNWEISRIRRMVLSFCCVLFSTLSFSQVTTEVDSTKIKIGEQITYKIQVEADTTSVVIFPEGQTFLPLEVIESYKIDTTKKDARYKLIKKYGLTQFDSGAYIIPKQKVVVGDKVILTDSLRVDVNNVIVDTTKQKLYDIKPIIEVDKKGSNWWKYLLVILLIIGLIAFLLYWFIWRQKPLTEEEKEALLPPYDRAKLALQKLENTSFLDDSEIKKYYSELTLIIRRFIDEKVYDRALESTTDQLIDRLNLLKDGNQYDFDKETIKNIESILKRADLVKFAKSTPDIELAKLDLTTVSKEVDAVKSVLPEPSEEEKLLDLQYKEQQERKKKRRKVLLTVAISLFLIIATVVGFGIKYGFTYVKDTIVGHESKELLEGNWVKSEYGFPPVYIETPHVLRRIQDSLPIELKDKLERSMFAFGSEAQNISIAVITIRALDVKDKQKQDDVERNVSQSIDQIIKEWEAKNVQNIITKGDQFTTPNGVEGIKTHGSAGFPIGDSEDTMNGDYAIFSFATNEAIMHVTLIWNKDDTYAEQMIDRIINSIELKSDAQANTEKEEQN